MMAVSSDVKVHVGVRGEQRRGWGPPGTGVRGDCGPSDMGDVSFVRAAGASVSPLTSPMGCRKEGTAGGYGGCLNMSKVLSR